MNKSLPPPDQSTLERLKKGDMHASELVYRTYCLKLPRAAGRHLDLLQDHLGQNLEMVVQSHITGTSSVTNRHFLMLL